MTAGRAAYIAGMRKWLDLLEASPEIPLPLNGTDPLSPQIINFGGDSAQEEMAAARRAIGGQWEKTVTEKWFKLRTHLDGFHLMLYAGRDLVCTRRVTGTEMKEVEEEVTPAVTRKVTKEVPIVEWDCGPLLAGGEHS